MVSVWFEYDDVMFIFLSFIQTCYMVSVWFGYDDIMFIFLSFIKTYCMINVWFDYDDVMFISPIVWIVIYSFSWELSSLMMTHLIIFFWITLMGQFRWGTYTFEHIFKNKF